MKWEKAGARYKEPVVASNQISRVIALASSSPSLSGPCELTVGPTCVYRRSLAFSIALYWCWIKLRALIFYGFPFFSCSFFFFALPAKINCKTKRITLLFAVIGENTAGQRLMTVDAQTPNFMDGPLLAIPGLMRSIFFIASLVLLDVCFGWGEIRGNLEKKPRLQACVISEPHYRQACFGGRGPCSCSLPALSTPCWG